MKKAYVIIAVTSLFVLASCGAKEVTENTSSSVEVQVAEEVVQTPSLPLYSTEAVANASENIVLFFHAEWCPTCRNAENAILEGETPSNLTILKVDFDNSDELRKKYGVTDKHTFVQIDSEGNELAKWSGSKDTNEIISKLVSEKIEVPVATKPIEKKVVKAEVPKVETPKVETPKVETPKVETKAEPVPEVVVKEVVSPEKVEEVIEEPVIVEEPVVEAVEAKGSYVPYKAELVGKTAKTVLYFHADWCPTCVRLAKNINAGEIPPGLTILNVNYDTEIALKKKYGVTYQTTLVYVDADGNMISKWNGGNLDTIISKTK